MPIIHEIAVLGVLVVLLLFWAFWLYYWQSTAACEPSVPAVFFSNRERIGNAGGYMLM